MELKELKISDKENSFKFVLIVNDKEVGFGYIFNREINPIEVYIEKEFQSNGYGKFLFNSLLSILKEKGLKGMLFKINESNYKFINIIQKAGAQIIGKQDLDIKFVLKI